MRPYSVEFFTLRRAMLPRPALLALPLLLSIPPGFSQSKKEPVLVFSGGNASCAQMNGASPAPEGFFRLHKAVASRVDLQPDEIPTVITCFRAVDRDSTRVEFTSNAPVEVSTYIEHISRLLATKTKPTLVFIGHSWGGVLAAEGVLQIQKILTNWSDDPRLSFLRDIPVMLVTIDAIDFNFCRKPYVTILGNTDCLSTPRSFASSGDLFPILAHSLRGWLNIYQREGLLLHGGPVEQFKNNPASLSNLNLTKFRLSPHMEIRSDQRTWDAISQRVDSFL